MARGGIQEIGPRSRALSSTAGFRLFKQAAHIYFPFLNQRDNMSSDQCSRMALKGAKPFGSELLTYKEGGFGVSATGGSEKRRIGVLRTGIRERTSGTW